MTERSATLAVVTREPLLVAQKQSLALSITTIGWQSILISLPLGDSAGALMSAAEFKRCVVSLVPAKPDGVMSPTKSLMSEQQPSGFVRIPIKPSGQQQQLGFTVVLRDFIVEQHAGTVAIELRGDGIVDAPLATVQVEKSAKLPTIKSFGASGYNVIKGNTVVLDWAVDPEGEYELLDAAQPAAPLTKGSGNAGRSGRLAAGDYVLNLLAGGRVVDTRRLRIHSFDATGFHSYALNLSKDGSTTDIVGLHAHPQRGRLYALLRFGAASQKAQLWSTATGFDFRPEAWQPERNGKGDIISITIEQARRPGVVFQDKLWLLGGDCCDPDRADAKVGCYDFQSSSWQEIDDDDDIRRWPPGMVERMGHAVVALPAHDRIWVMGGWSQNGGACNDIWAFNGDTWNRLAQPCDGCLFGAVATSEAVWRVGGFPSPGDAAGTTAVERYDMNGNRTAIDFSIADRMKYCAGGLFSLDAGSDRPCGVATFYDPVRGTYVDKAFFINKERSYNVAPKTIEELSTEGVFLKRDYYHIQAAVFQGAAFFRMLRPDMKPAGARVSYMVWVD